MGYSNFKTLKKVVKDFGLDSELTPLFKKITKVSPSQRLLENLEMAKIFPLTNEKSKPERLVSPILLEVAIQYKDKITFFSGENVDVDTSKDLNGPCDFFFALQKPKLYLETPIIWAKLFNECEGKNIAVLYGCVSTGVAWQFIRFENGVFYIDTKSYTDLEEVLGIWHHILQLYLK